MTDRPLSVADALALIRELGDMARDDARRAAFTRAAERARRLADRLEEADRAQETAIAGALAEANARPDLGLRLAALADVPFMRVAATLARTTPGPMRTVRGLCAGCGAEAWEMHRGDCAELARVQPARREGGHDAR